MSHIHPQKHTHSKDRILQLKLDMCHSHCVHGDSAMIHTKTYELRDGTQCLTANSLGVCLAGECMPVDCSHTLGANSSKDECGVWCGSGDSCWKVSGVYNNVSQHGSEHMYSGITFYISCLKLRMSCKGTIRYDSVHSQL